MKMAVVLITGTNSGIGLATALRFARRGDQVYATMRNLDRAEHLRKVAAAHRLAVTILQLDVTDETSVQNAVRDVESRSGPVDILVNNAGIMPLAAIERSAESMVQAVFDTNLFGPLRAIRAVLPGMRARGSGTIINVSSMAGRVPALCMGIYTASKHALEAASEALAAEVLPYGIRVALVEPAFVETPLLDQGAATLAPSPASPYWDAERRLAAVMGQMRQSADAPEAVAEVILQAVITAEPRLRYPVGQAAPVVMAGYARSGADAFVELSKVTSDDEWFGQFGALLAPPVAAGV
jgi:NAD(P)-dependent dehydrogenase (short-subunit alcohol dehydrogenase family)